MLDAIDGARRQVLLEMYLVESGEVVERFFDALLAAAGRGVEVRVLLDDLGALALRRGDRQRLAVGAVQLAFYNPLRARAWHRLLARNHRKLLVVDGEVAFTGGAGLSDWFCPRAQPQAWWHETMIAIRGPCVGDWQGLFVETWSRWSSVSTTRLRAPGALAGGHGGRVAVHGRAMARSEIMRSFVMRVRQARRRVWLATAYFLPPAKLRRALQRSARQGVDVRLIVPGPLSDHPSLRHLGRRYYERLLRNGVRIYEYQPRFLHAKVVLCDDWVSIGSSNLDRWNHRWNLEANQELSDCAIAARIAALFENDFAASKEIRYAQWLHRPFYRRWLETLLARIEDPIMRLSDWKNRRRGPPGPL